MSRNGPCLKTGQIDLFLIQNIQIIEGNKIARNSHRKVNTCYNKKRATVGRPLPDTLYFFN